MPPATTEIASTASASGVTRRHRRKMVANILLILSFTLFPILLPFLAFSDERVARQATCRAYTSSGFLFSRLILTINRYVLLGIPVLSARSHLLIIFGP